ncbi:hypothetical protein DIE06_08035 [Burkholderia sp. Bp8998]|nr:hypothetical protein DIE06_08035 [Burkholderia sp. Bp8998]
MICASVLDAWPVRIGHAGGQGRERQRPGVTIDAVEIDPEVIALRDVFRIPAENVPGSSRPPGA